jgi:ferredoxin
MRRKRQLIRIDEEKCDGCGLCVHACAEGALALVNGKARLVSETYCDGLGACIGECPQGAITIEERETEDFNELAAKRHVAGQAGLGQAAHAKAPDALPRPMAPPCACPGSAVRAFAPAAGQRGEAMEEGPASETLSQLGNWPIQLTLAPPVAPHYAGARLLLSADCAPFAYGGFHERLLPGRVLLIACPKLDDAEFYREKLTYILQANPVAGLDVAFMEVPCCFGLVRLAQEALAASGKDIPLRAIRLGIHGDVLEERVLSGAANAVPQALR